MVLDLDSKHDNGKSVNKFLAQAGPKAQVLPRERTGGGMSIGGDLLDEAMQSLFVWTDPLPI